MLFDGAGEKAILYIYICDIDKASDLKTELKNVSKFEEDLRTKAKKKIGVGENLKEGFKGIGSDIKDFFTPGNKNSDKIAELVPGTSFAKFTVQYNPATIKLSSVNGKVQSRRADEGIDSLKMYKFAGKSKLCFDLIFDDCDNMNAFMLNDVVNTNISSALKKGYDVYSHGGLNHSVRKRMDSIMSLLTDARVQQVVFYWSKMVFRGTVTDVANRYTMFNPKGNPIRGEMHLELTQDKKKKEDMGFDNKYWREAFKEVFKDSKEAGVAGEYTGKSGLSQGLSGSLLNLNL